jgi:hypothetical protein
MAISIMWDPVIFHVGLIMGKTKRKNKLIKKLNINRTDKISKWVKKSEDDIMLKAYRFELQSPKKKIDWNNPYEQTDLDYNLVGWEQGLP